jgi:hypothetical protein
MLARFLVISYDSDQQETIYDHIIAEDDPKRGDGEVAMEIAGKLRPNAVPVSAMTARELREMADHMMGRSDEAIKTEMDSLAAAH